MIWLWGKKREKDLTRRFVVNCFPSANVTVWVDGMMIVGIECLCTQEEEMKLVVEPQSNRILAVVPDEVNKVKTNNLACKLSAATEHNVHDDDWQEEVDNDNLWVFTCALRSSIWGDDVLEL